MRLVRAWRVRRADIGNMVAGNGGKKGDGEQWFWLLFDPVDLW